MRAMMVGIITVFLLVGCTDADEDTTEQTSPTPEGPLDMIVPTSAGGGTDTIARVLATSAEPHVDASIGIENIPGGSNAIGMLEGANAEPDGETLTMVVAELVMLDELGLAELSPEQLEPVAMVNLDPAALTVPADAPYDTIEEFIEYAEKNPDDIQIGNAGTGSIWHVAAEAMGYYTDTSYTHVPYDGAGPAVTELVGGHIDAVTVSVAEVLPHVEAGELKTLAVMSDERSEALPDVPTFEEAGFDSTTLGTWRGIMVPANTPDETVEFLESAFLEAAEDEEFQEYLENGGFGLDIRDADEFQEYIDEQEDFFETMISQLGLSGDE